MYNILRVYLRGIITKFVLCLNNFSGIWGSLTLVFNIFRSCLSSIFALVNRHTVDLVLVLACPKHSLANCQWLREQFIMYRTAVCYTLWWSCYTSAEMHSNILYTKLYWKPGKAIINHKTAIQIWTTKLFPTFSSGSLEWYQSTLFGIG